MHNNNNNSFEYSYSKNDSKNNLNNSFKIKDKFNKNDINNNKLFKDVNNIVNEFKRKSGISLTKKIIYNNSNKYKNNKNINNPHYNENIIYKKIFCSKIKTNEEINIEMNEKFKKKTKEIKFKNNLITFNLKINDPNFIRNKIIREFKDYDYYSDSILAQKKLKHEKIIDYMEKQKNYKFQQIKNNLDLFDKIKNNSKNYSINQIKLFKKNQKNNSTISLKRNKYLLSNSNLDFSRENEVKEHINNIKKINIKNARKKSILLSESLTHINSLPYEKINKNIKKDFIYNYNNLNRKIRVININKITYDKDYDDFLYEYNHNLLKQECKNINFKIITKFKNNFTKFIKNKFKLSTEHKYSHILGKFLGPYNAL